jgi:hypothetical protein
MRPLSDVLFGLYRGTPQHGEWVVACLEGSWPALLGERLAAVCRPRRLDGGCLLIEIIDPSWADALRGMRTELCDRIGSATRNEVRQVKFRETSEADGGA